MPHQIVYLSHGGPKYYEQTRFSVLSLLDLLIRENRRDIEIIICTDRVSESPEHELVSSIFIEREELARFRGPLDFVHRVKLEALRRVESEIGLPFLYVDSDTRWLKIPDAPLAALSALQTSEKPTVYLHKFEKEISARRFPQYFRLLQQKRKKLAEWNLPEDGPWNMWNCGAIGIPAGANGLLEKALEITDDLLLDVRYRNCVEQLAVSLLAASRYRVEPLEEYLAHYWAYGSELPVVLRRFFQNLPPSLTAAQQAAKSADFPIREEELKTIQQSRENRFRNWRAKIRNSFYKRKIDLRAYWLRRRRDRAI